MKKENEEMEIHVIYESSEGKHDTFYDIIHNGAGYEFYELDSEAFWGLNGGIEIVLDGYKTVFRSTDFNYLVQVVSFLLHSLYYIKDQKNDWFGQGEQDLDGIVLKTTGDNFLRLKGEQGIVKLSFLNNHTPKVQSIRGCARYFDDIYIDQNLWFNAAKIALEEYFTLLLQVVNVFPDSKTSIVMMRFYGVWKQING